MTKDPKIIIAGAGQAGLQAAASLRQLGHQGPILLIGDEIHLPYQRPPLSKDYYKDGKPERLLFRNAEFFIKNGIDLALGTAIVGMDRARRTVRLTDGRDEAYDHLILALGARNRKLPIEGTDLAGVMELRSLDDAEAIRRHTAACGHVVVIGGGFIGLEAAAVFRAADIGVTVLEAAPRLMARAVTPAVSDYFLAAHRLAGADVRLNAVAARILAAGDGRVSGVELADGSRIAAQGVLIATGVVPNAEVAADAGLRVQNGIVTDGFLATSDPAISAIGDCAAVPQGSAGPHLRLESVQAAVDQAKCLAERLTGAPRPYAKAPWFWSDQGAHKLQIAGLAGTGDRTVVSGSLDEGRLVVRSFLNGDEVCVETVNAPADHLAARRALDQRATASWETARA